MGTVHPLASGEGTPPTLPRRRWTDTSVSQADLEREGGLTSAEKSVGSRAAALGAPKVIIVTGPTAVGKTELALRLAEELNGEIISADSIQVYRGLDIGSDKLPFDKVCCIVRRAWSLAYANAHRAELFCG